MTVLPNTDTDQVGNIITTEFGNSPLAWATPNGLKNVAPFVYGTSFEGDTVTEDSVEEAPAAETEASVETPAEAPVVAPEAPVEEQASVSASGIIHAVEHDVEGVVAEAEHEAEVLGEDAEAEAQRIETDVKDFVEGA